MPKHIPVLQSEVIDLLDPKSNQNFIDATVGLGGHAKLILEKTSPKGKLLAIDQDESALDEAKNNLADFSDRVSYGNCNFAELGLVIREWPVEEVNGILFDLGVSSLQLDEAERGFSFRQDGPLDMRMSKKTGKTAADVVNHAEPGELVRILRAYGEERFAREIVREIVFARKQRPIERTSELVEIILKAVPDRYHIGRIHPATQTFQALRIATNDEIKNLESGLKQALQILTPGGRIAVISFHSLEDRIVKNLFLENNLTILTKKPIQAGDEIAQNPRARSAKLRAAEK